jgi:hypothetical protein
VNRRVLSRADGIHYAWIVFAVTFITLLAASGIRSTPAVLMVPLEAEFGWSRATISLAVSINLVLVGIIGMIVLGLVRAASQGFVAQAPVMSGDEIGDASDDHGSGRASDRYPTPGAACELGEEAPLRSRLD